LFANAFLYSSWHIYLYKTWHINNPDINNHFKLQIKTLQHVPREEDKSCKHFESKTKGKAVAGNTHGRHSKVGYREIEMLQVVLYLRSRKRDPCSYSFLGKELGFI
jgi:hypothetical protein